MTRCALGTRISAIEYNAFLAVISSCCRRSTVRLTVLNNTNTWPLGGFLSGYDMAATRLHLLHGLQNEVYALVSCVALGGTRAKLEI